MEQDVLDFNKWDNDQKVSMSIAINVSRQISNMTTLKTKIIKESLNLCDGYFTVNSKVYPNTPNVELEDFWKEHCHLQITVPETGDIIVCAYIDDNIVRVTPSKQNIKLPYIKLLTDRLQNIMTNVWANRSK